MRVRNWRRFQHYSDRNPPWIKLHFSLLSSSDWVMLDDQSRLLAIVCMLLASRNEGEIDVSESGLAYIQRVAYLTKKPNIKPLIDCGFLEDASTCKQTQAKDTTETEERQSRGETESMSSRLDVIPPKPEYLSQAKEVLQFLNAKTGKNFRPVKANLDMIVARLKEGATVTECRAVIVRKCREWGTDEKMAKYLRPGTLFNATKFAQYSGEVGSNG